MHSDEIFGFIEWILFAIFYLAQGNLERNGDTTGTQRRRAQTVTGTKRKADEIVPSSGKIESKEERTEKSQAATGTKRKADDLGPPDSNMEYKKERSGS